MSPIECATMDKLPPVPFNKPFIVGKELFYIAQAVTLGNLAGDGYFTQQCCRTLEERFTFLMRQLKIDGTAAAVQKFVTVPQLPIDREAEVLAAGGKITAAEKKAEGLAD